MQGSYNQVAVMLESVYLSPQLPFRSSFVNLWVASYVLSHAIYSSSSKESKNTLHIKQNLLHVLRCKSYKGFKQKLIHFMQFQLNE